MRVRGLTFAMPFGVLGFLWGLLSGHVALGLLWLVAMVVNRWLQAAAVLTALGDSEWATNTAIYPLRDLLENVLVHACSFAVGLSDGGGECRDKQQAEE